MEPFISGSDGQPLGSQHRHAPTQGTYPRAIIASEAKIPWGVDSDRV
jgi:hypothetical protein